MHPKPSSFPSTSDIMQRSLGRLVWGRGRGPGGSVHAPVMEGMSQTDAPFLCSADVSTSHSRGCYPGPSTYAETAVGLCPTPTELQDMLSREKGCVGRQEGWGA